MSLRPVLASAHLSPNALTDPPKATHNGHQGRKRAHSTYRHVVPPLGVVAVQLLALLALVGRNALQRICHVLAHVLVPVLVEAERAAGVLHEQVQQADAVGRELRELRRDAVRHQVGPARRGGERELFLEPHGVGERRGVGLAGVEADGWEEGGDEKEREEREEREEGGRGGG